MAFKFLRFTPDLGVLAPAAGSHLGRQSGGTTATAISKTPGRPGQHSDNSTHSFNQICPASRPDGGRQFWDSSTYHTTPTSSQQRLRGWSDKRWNLPRGARNSGVRKRLGGGQRGPCSPSSRARVPGPCRASLPRASLPRATSTAWLRTVHFWGYVHGGGPPNPPAMKSA